MQLISYIDFIVAATYVDCSVGFSLAICQLVLNPSSLSNLCILRFITELLVVALAFFVLCDCSESLNGCHSILRGSLATSSWYKCSPRTMKCLMMMLRRVAQDNKLRHCGGMVVWSRVQYLKVVKIGYTFANTMRLRVG